VLSEKLVAQICTWLVIIVDVDGGDAIREKRRVCVGAYSAEGRARKSAAQTLERRDAQRSVADAIQPHKQNYFAF